MTSSRCGRNCVVTRDRFTVTRDFTLLLNKLKYFVVKEKKIS